MPLNHLQIITLQNINGCDKKSIFTIAEYVDKNALSIKDNIQLFDVIEKLKSEQYLRNFPVIKLKDLEYSHNKAKEIIEGNKKYGIGIISYYDNCFPQILRETLDDYGRWTPPILLYYRGNIEALSKPGVAIVGTRNPTKDGMLAGEYLASELAQKGINVISGLALGCDTCAHQGALNAGGTTTAFLAHGLDYIYPVENKVLSEKITRNGGLLLSEYAIGTRSNKSTFVERDRLQSGLGFATIVVQTTMNGGTMHAANSTLKAQKPLYCVWFKDINTRQHEVFKGNDFLVRKGGVYLSKKIQIETLVNKLNSKSLNL
jgi:DNA processing protein